MPEDEISGVQFRSLAAKINAAAGIVALLQQASVVDIAKQIESSLRFPLWEPGVRFGSSPDPA
jgi:hypothetical protein